VSGKAQQNKATSEVSPLAMSMLHVRLVQEAASGTGIFWLQHASKIYWLLWSVGPIPRSLQVSGCPRWTN